MNNESIYQSTRITSKFIRNKVTYGIGMNNRATHLIFVSALIMSHYACY